MRASGRRSADETLAASLAAGKTVAESATAAGVSEATAYRRFKVPAFAARVRELRAAMVATALGRLTDGMTAAADALNELVQSAEADAKFKAAKAVIELALRVREQVDLEERLAAVERALKGGGDERSNPSTTEADREGVEEADDPDR